MTKIRCNDACRDYSRNTRAVVDLYVKKYMRCPCCDCMVPPGDIRRTSSGVGTCPCCHTRLISKPRSARSKERFRKMKE